MTAELTLTSRWMTHTGGTKFYRPVLVSLGGRTVVVANYGSTKPRGGSAPSASHRPAQFGQCKVYSGGAAYFERLTAEKERVRNGEKYVRVGSDLIRHQSVESLDDDGVKSALAIHFGAAVAHEVLQHLRPAAGWEDWEVPSSARDTIPVETTPRPEGWGSW